VANTWWRNRAATVANAGAGGQGAITSATTNGGALIEFLEKEWLQLSKYRQGSSRYKLFAGSDFIAAATRICSGFPCLEASAPIAYSSSSSVVAQVAMRQL
jgi:hypothetical protein